MLLFTLPDGVEYSFDDDALDIDEACDVKKFTGLGVREFILGIRLQDPIAMRAMVWLTLRRAGKDVQIADIKFDFYEFMTSLRQPDDEPGETTGEADESADPTTSEPENSAGSDTGTTPPGDEPTTSEPSPSTSA